LCEAKDVPAKCWWLILPADPASLLAHKQPLGNNKDICVMILSLPKLLGLFAVIWLVWTAFRFFEERQKNLANQPSDDGESKSSGGAGAAKNEANATSVDLQECDVCGAWVSGETCECENCPY
jgi:hypothetical protein